MVCITLFRAGSGYAAYIRKAYPRNDITPTATGASDFEKRDTSEVATQLHRVLRRGIPFGEELSHEEQESQTSTQDRGLMFISYQTSIEDQFEFILKNWVNNPRFAVGNVGFDPILGQAQGAVRTRAFVGATINYPVGPSGPATTIPSDFIVPTRGGYFLRLRSTRFARF